MLEFIIIAFFVQFSAVAYLVQLYRFPGRAFRYVIPYLRPKHQSELDDLLDPLREENLASALGHTRFRTEQLKRIHLAQECIAQRTHNARIFQEWGDTELERSAKMFAHATGESANRLVEACLDYRLNAWLVRGRLYAAYLAMVLLPLMRIPRLSRLCRSDGFDLLNSYAAVEKAAEMLASRCGDEYRDELMQTLRPVRHGASDPRRVFATGRG